MTDVREITRQGLTVIVLDSDQGWQIKPLTERIKQILEGYGPCEIIVLNNDFTDIETQFIDKIDGNCPVKFINKPKIESKNALFSRGLSAAQYSTLAVISSDSQCGWEQLGHMYSQINEGIADVVVIDRWWRPRRGFKWLLAWLYRYLVVLPLFFLSYDTRSGLIMFRREFLPVAKSPTGRWNFGLFFLWRVKHMKARISNVAAIYCSQKKKSIAKSFLGGYQILAETILTRFRRFATTQFEDDKQPNQAGNGIAHKGKNIITHSSLPINRSAFQRLNLWQRIVGLCLILLLILALIADWQGVLLWGVVVMSVIYLLDLVLMFFVVLAGLTKSSEITFEKQQLTDLNEENLPMYTILCPLYKEAEVIDQFVDAMLDIDWPADKLDIQLLIEEDDEVTRGKLAQIQLPAQFTVQLIPDGEPKTKPKACNYGLAYAKGDYVVIFDAEDIPEPDQLKKAYLAFSQAGSDLVCMQAKLDYYNAKQNLLTRLFAVEYNLWFGVVLPSLYALRAPIPLGGTSNHFRSEALHRLSGWDPFNVTEDCDLGIRLFSMGLRTGVIDSYTHEEANSQLGNWIRQRSRWIKGYLQTQLVASRNINTIAQQGFFKLLVFFLLFGHKSWSLFINPILWILTIGFFVQPHLVKPITELFFSGPIGYIGGVTMIIGNFLYFYANMLAALKTKQWWMVKYAFVVPIYWLLMSVAGCYGFWQLITKPHYWEKTRHGLHVVKTSPQPIPIERVVEFS
jgi:cellulose synthase/poly-beta-1,6-N-acetylglucosamine synthase-like glycosyltransferase